MKRKRVAFTWYLYWRYPLEAIKDIKREVECFFERGWYGYSYMDGWGLSWYLSTWLPHALRKFKKGTGYPGYGEANTYKKWGKLVEKMALGFEAARKIEDLETNRKKIARLQKTEREGLGLFVKWFGHLWD